MTLGKPVALHCSTVKIGRKSKVVYTTVGRAGSGEGASKRPSRMWGCTVQTAQEEATPASLPLRRPRLTAPRTRCRLWIVACHLHEHRLPGPLPASDLAALQWELGRNQFQKTPTAVPALRNPPLPARRKDASTFLLSSLPHKHLLVLVLSSHQDRLCFQGDS